MITLVALYGEDKEYLVEIENAEVEHGGRRRGDADEEPQYRVAFDLFFPIMVGGLYYLGDARRPIVKVRVLEIGPGAVEGRIHVKAVEER